jgi:hypothetical protein
VFAHWTWGGEKDVREGTGETIFQENQCPLAPACYLAQQVFCVLLLCPLQTSTLPPLPISLIVAPGNQWMAFSSPISW